MNIFPVFFAAAKIGIGRGPFYFATTKIRIGRGALLRQGQAPLRRLLLRIMPPSWHPVPACVSHSHSADGQSLLLQRWCCRRAVLSCSSDGAASILKSGPEIKNRCTLALRLRSAGETILCCRKEN